MENPHTMLSQKTLDYLDHYLAGEQSETEQAEFLRVLAILPAKDLETLADEYEARERQAIPSMQGPSKEWVAKLEAALNASDQRQRQKDRIRREQRRAAREIWITGLITLFLLLAIFYCFYKAHPIQGLTVPRK